jgi:hypothetical protein
VNKPRRDQRGIYNLFSRFVKDDGTIIHAEFAEDIAKLRQYGDGLEFLQPKGSSVDDKSPFFLFINKYKFPPTMHLFLIDYISRNEINPDKISHGVYVVDERTGEASGVYDPVINSLGYVADYLATDYIKLSLAIPTDATNLQIREAIKEAKNFIKSKQVEARGGPIARKRFSVNAELNNWIMVQYKQGLKPRQIFSRLPDKFKGTVLTPQDISNIISRQNK